MKRNIYKAIRCLISVILLSHAAGNLEAFDQAPVIESAGGDPADIAGKILPPNFGLAHPVLSGTFGPAAGNLVVLAWQREGDPLTAWVLVPQMPETSKYVKYALPRSDAMHGYTGVEAVFFANVDRDPENELLILCSQMTGIGPTGAKPWYETYVYDWAGSRFVLLESVRKRLFNLSTANAVRKKLNGSDHGTSHER